MWFPWSRALQVFLGALVLAVGAAGTADGAGPRFAVRDTHRLSDVCGLAYEDVTADGRRDLVAGRFFGGGVLQTLPALGGGGFGRVRRSAAHGLGPFLCLSELVDIDRDGRRDAVGVEGSADDPDGIGAQQVWISYGEHGGTFAVPTVLGPPRGLTDLTITTLDINSDGRLDIATLEGRVPDWDQTGTRVRLFENLGRRRFRSRLAAAEDGSRLPELAGVFELMAGDLNRDGATDLIAANYDNHKGPGAVLLATGVGRFRVSPAPDPLSSWQPADLADLNEDGTLDFVTMSNAVGRDSSVLVAAGDGTGGFSTPQPTGASLPGEQGGFDLADLDGDGHLDIVASTPAGLNLFNGDGHGAFSPGRALRGTAGMGGPIVFADVNRDHRTDLLGEWYPDDCDGRDPCGGLRVLIAQPAEVHAGGAGSADLHARVQWTRDGSTW